MKKHPRSEKTPEGSHIIHLQKKSNGFSPRDTFGSEQRVTFEDGAPIDEGLGAFEHDQLHFAAAWSS